MHLYLGCPRTVNLGVYFGVVSQASPQARVLQLPRAVRMRVLHEFDD